MRSETACQARAIRNRFSITRQRDDFEIAFTLWNFAARHRDIGQRHWRRIKFYIQENLCIKNSCYTFQFFFFFILIFPIFPYPLYIILFSIPLSGWNIRNSTTRYLARCYIDSLSLLSFSDTVCPYPIFSSTARKANEYERLTVPRYKSRRPRLVNRSRKERRGEEQGGKARGREERQPVRGRKKNRYGRPPFHRVPRHYVTRLESWHCVTRWCQDEWLRKLSILPRASFYLVLCIFRRRRSIDVWTDRVFFFSFFFFSFSPSGKRLREFFLEGRIVKNSVNLRCLPTLFARSTARCLR